VVLAALLTALPCARAQPDLGPEFQVNTYTTGPQRSPAVAMHGDGSFVVAWSSGSYYGYHDAPGDSASGAFLQRFDAAGAPVGDEQHVNTFTPGDQFRPDVAALPGGAFVVVWESGCYSRNPGCSPDGSRRAVTLQRFDAAGAAEGGELVVNTFTAGNQGRGAVASAASGAFVVTWASGTYGGVPPDHDDYGIAGRLFTADGAPAGDEFQVNVATLGFQGEPDVAMDADGTFVAVWNDLELGIRGRRFDASGVPLGEIQVASDEKYVQTPRVTLTGGGEFVVVWSAYDYEPLRGGEIRARRFAADGTSLGPAFAVNSYVPGDQYRPALAADAAGNFVVSWTSYDYFGGGQDGDVSGVFAQVFTHDAVPLGGEFQVNVFTTSRQHEPDVAAGAPGEFVVTWTTTPYYGRPPQDGDLSGVFARRMSLRTCAETADCDDANPCTTDACEDGLCLDRRQAGCCQSDAECWDDDPSTDDVCVATACTNPPIPGCVRCARDNPCVAPNACTTAVCELRLGRCELTPVVGCCLAAVDCDDGFTCTEDTCGPGNVCASMPIPDCVPCSEDAECRTGCLIGPETCSAGRCASPAGCPVVTIDDRDPIGAAGKLLARVQIPAGLPGKGKIKAVVTGRVGPLDPPDQPSRRCKEGKVLGRARATLAPGGDTNLLLALRKAGARCLAQDPDGALPVDVTVGVKRKKTRLTLVTEPRTWRQ